MFILFALILGNFLFFGRENLYIFSCLTALMIILFLLKCFIKGTYLKLPINLLTILLSLYTVWLMASLWWTDFSTLNSVCAFLLSYLTLSYGLSLAWFQKSQAWIKVIGSSSFVVGVFGLWGCIQYWFLHQPPQATLQDKNLLATLLGSLMLILFSSYFLLPKTWLRRSFLIGLAVLSFAFSTIYGRVASVAFFGLLGMALLLLYKNISLKEAKIPLATLIISYSLPRLLAFFPFFPPLTTYLGDSWQQRLILWKITWQMILTHPWLGFGLGSFPYVYAQFRPAADQTAGFFVHNDFLQIWVEAGLPAVCLLLAIPFSAAWVVWKLFRQKEITREVRIEAIFLLAGIGSIYLNAFFSFDLYYEPGLLIVGLFLGRLSFLGFQHKALPTVHFRLGEIVRPVLLRSFILIMGLWSLFYFFTIGYSYYLSNQGIQALEEGKFALALKYALLIQGFRPSYESGYILASEVYMRSSANKQLNLEQRKMAYEMTQKQLDQAEKTHPWDPLIPTIRGRLEVFNADWLPHQGSEKISGFFQEALRRDPRYYSSRVFYGSYLMEKGNYPMAAQILLDGITYPYPLSPGLGNYYRLTAKAVRQLKGYEEYANYLEKLAQKVP